MPTMVAICFTFFLLLGNLCPKQLLAYATHPSHSGEVEMVMTPADEELMTCQRRTPSPQPITFTATSQDTCSSGHCLAKSDPTVGLPLSPLSPATASTSIAWSPLLHSSPPLSTSLALNQNSSIGPPINHLKTIVLRV